MGLLLALPLLLPVLLFLVLPLGLAASALAERLRRCPRCGRRGTWRDVTPPRPPGPEEGDWSTTLIPRIVTARRWRCEVCGAEFGGVSGQPPRPAAASPSDQT